MKHVHFIGIGGIGMSGIAEVLLNLGYKVSGSDVASSETTARLKKLGATIYEGHDGKNVKGAEVVVYSSAVKPDNSEILSAKENNIPVIPRAEMLAELMRMKVGIAVAGMHGKTTTTSMISTILSKGGLDPTVVIGGKLNAIDTNAKLGKGKYLVAEADESDKSFLLLSPKISIVTNIDPEHLDHYKGIEDIKSTFVQFLDRLPITGLAILCIDDKNVKDLVGRVKRPVITYGTDPKANFSVENIEHQGIISSFNCLKDGKPLGRIKLPMPGEHNVLNCLASIVVALEVGMDFSEIQKAVESFKGVQRRFTIKGEKHGITLVDDYAHHPTEIEATIKAAKQSYPSRRIVVTFQPHRYTRTRDLFDQFVTCFGEADLVLITDIYPASEAPIEGISGEKLFDSIVSHGHKDVLFCPNREEIPSTLWPRLKKNDIVLTMGAGDISHTGVEILNYIQEHGVTNE